MIEFGMVPLKGSRALLAIKFLDDYWTITELRRDRILLDNVLDIPRNYGFSPIDPRFILVGFSGALHRSGLPDTTYWRLDELIRIIQRREFVFTDPCVRQTNSHKRGRGNELIMFQYDPAEFIQPDELIMFQYDPAEIIQPKEAT